MATTSKSQCIICNRQRSTFRCSGCSQDFCFNHLTDHKRQLNKQLDEVELNRDLFRQTLKDRISKPQKHVLIQEIDKWEQDSINKIRQTANETRQIIFEYTNQNVQELETKLTNLTQQLKQSRDENDFSEIDLHRWNEQLVQMTKDLIKPMNINIRQDNTQLVTKIAVDVVTSPNFSYKIPVAVAKKWISNGFTVAGGNGRGARINQLSNPWGLWITDDQTVYVADYGNARIIEKKCNTINGHIIAGGNVKGNDAYQLSAPIDILMDEDNDCFIVSDYGNKQVVRWPFRNGGSKQILIGNISCWGIALDNEGYLYVADCNRHEVRKWRIGETNGMLVAGGNGSGNRLDQLRGRFYICVDDEQSVYVSDEENHRIMKWIKGAKEGIIVAGGQGRGNNLSQLSNPEGIAVDSLGNIYVSDTDNHRIMRWNKGSKQGTIVAGGYGKGDQANQLSSPLGLKLDRQGNLYAVDNGNCRVQRFDIDSK